MTIDSGVTGYSSLGTQANEVYTVVYTKVYTT